LSARRTAGIGRSNSGDEANLGWMRKEKKYETGISSGEERDGRNQSKKIGIAPFSGKSPVAIRHQTRVVCGFKLEWVA
jgi:hypothetical protein